MNRATTRRDAIRIIAGTALLAAGADRGLAGKFAGSKTARIEHLIEQARRLPNVSRRIDFISHALLGVRYQANPLIGGPRRPERFVVRDDAFDCVTFCEIVLAAAIARSIDEFRAALRRIRYNHGDVQYAQRNHYFAEWGQRSIENHICQPVALTPTIKIEKTVSWHRELDKRRVSIDAVATPTLLNNTAQLKSGDIIGFVSRRSNLDIFHTGFVVFDKKGALRLRHASRSRGRVVEEKMKRFVAANRVKYVMLLRAVEPRSQMSSLE